jgi:cysteine desulfurase/selenocysteine lyase
MFDSKQIRKDFPFFQRRINGKPIVYLDSAATSLKPEAVLRAMGEYYTQYTANIHRGIYTISEEATRAYDTARKKVAEFIGAKQTEEVIFTRNATEGFNLIASTYGRQKITAEDSIVTTMLEHHGNFIPWQQLAAEKHAYFIVIPLGKEGIIEQKLLEKYITRTTKIFTFSALSNVLGTIQDVKAIIATIKSIAPDCCIIVDAAQAVGRNEVNVSKWNADFVAFSGHKIFGPTGIGVVWGKQNLLQDMPPYQFGGDMIKEVWIEKTVFADPPQKFEAGTPAIAEAIGLGAAVDYLSKLGIKHIRNHEVELITYALNKMNVIEGLEVYGPQDPHLRGGVIAFTLNGVHPHDISQILNEDNVCIRAGHHCAMPLHTYLGLSATARISFNVYTTKEDIDICIEGLQRAIKIFT